MKLIEYAVGTPMLGEHSSCGNRNIDTTPNTCDVFLKRHVILMQAAATQMPNARPEN
jgi:hypothetical protein